MHPQNLSVSMAGTPGTPMMVVVVFLLHSLSSTGQTQVFPTQLVLVPW